MFAVLRRIGSAEFRAMSGIASKFVWPMARLANQSQHIESSQSFLKTSALFLIGNMRY